ncbi:U3 small nucleolar RNA-associated protein 14 homolog A [Musca domestica]|uniref:U3 small nucleolar RNA-associated protein 14 homolog A n=1 Tax=Musca domestica TaxID=7370 RepID=A0A1I8MZH9_MUSDO|nr:U3 small nucleolar RNA-associated protein 14 homolog A [Musca domestica]
MSDDEEQINPKSHKQLLQAISSLGKTQHIRKSTRDEPKLVQDEFQLVKGLAVVSKPKAQPVAINDLVQVLKGNKKLLETGKELKKTVTTKKVLEKPLEKPAAERIKRTIGYENVKAKLAKWDAVVASNRSAETQVFPLKSETIYVNTSLRRKPLEQSVKTDLMLQMEELENKYAKMKREHLGDTQDPAELEKQEQQLLQKKLTKEELIAKRKELAYLKMREAQKSVKARLQKKIKSKKYHKLLKKQKMQEQIKQFELLQKTNPEAAMEKLNALEKSRVLERASLRHKNTGTWAKNLQIRAKYDKDVRKDLSEQLQISRELTQKVKDEDSDQEMPEEKKEELDEDDPEYDPFNPWTTVGKKDKANATEQGESNWRKYWLERNDNEKMLEEYKRLLNEEQGEEEEEQDQDEEEKEDVAKNEEGPLEDKDQNESDQEKDAAVPKKKAKGDTKAPTKSLKRKKEKKPDIKPKPNKNQKLENGWLVEEIDPVAVKSIDDIFDAQEDRIREKLQKKLDIINEKGKKLKESKKDKKKSSKGRDPLKNLKDLSFKNKAVRPEIDEELKNELDEKADESVKINETLDKAMSTKSNDTTETKSTDTSTVTDTIDPTKLATVKLKQHGIGFGSVSEAMGDVDMADEDDDPIADQQMTIAQAFEDDDIIADFSRDKTKDSELKDAEIQLSMPGWGSWAGAGISKEQMERRNKRLLLKLAPEEKRKDENKEGVYINENVNKKLRNHLVSDVPFPFTSLKDYEASIRAPLGRNFVTETAFRLLTRPSVITQKGKIIEPMDESELIKPARKLRNPVDIRIAKMAAEAKS